MYQEDPQVLANQTSRVLPSDLVIPFLLAIRQNLAGLTDQADQRVYEREGRDAVLECPTNAYSGFVKCTFTDPFGNDFLMVGR